MQENRKAKNENKEEGQKQWKHENQNSSAQTSYLIEVNVNFFWKI